MIGQMRMPIKIRHWPKDLLKNLKKAFILQKMRKEVIQKLSSTVDDELSGLDWEYAPGKDIIKINLNNPLPAPRIN